MTNLGSTFIIRFAREINKQEIRDIVDRLFSYPDDKNSLYGHPIWLGDRKAHIYGLETRTWSDIFIDISCTRCIVVAKKLDNWLVSLIKRYIEDAIGEIAEIIKSE